MPHVFGDDKDKIHGRFLHYPRVGMRVTNCDGKRGTIHEPVSTYNVTVEYDDGLRYTTSTACLYEILPSCPEQCDGKHHHEPCPDCKDVHRIVGWIPGRVMGGGWVPGASFHECRTCKRRLSYVPDKN